MQFLHQLTDASDPVAIDGTAFHIDPAARAFTVRSDRAAQHLATIATTVYAGLVAACPDDLIRLVTADRDGSRVTFTRRVDDVTRPVAVVHHRTDDDLTELAVTVDLVRGLPGRKRLGNVFVDGTRTLTRHGHTDQIESVWRTIRDRYLMNSYDLLDDERDTRSLMDVAGFTDASSVVPSAWAAKLDDPPEPVELFAGSARHLLAHCIAGPPAAV